MVLQKKPTQITTIPCYNLLPYLAKIETFSIYTTFIDNICKISLNEISVSVNLNGT